MLLLGNMVFAPTADKYGRRITLVVSLPTSCLASAKLLPSSYLTPIALTLTSHFLPSSDLKLTQLLPSFYLTLVVYVVPRLRWG